MTSLNAWFWLFLVSFALNLFQYWFTRHISKMWTETADMQAEIIDQLANTLEDIINTGAKDDED